MIDPIHRAFGYCAEMKSWGHFAACVCGYKLNEPHEYHKCMVQMESGQPSPDCVQWPNENNSQATLDNESRPS